MSSEIQNPQLDPNVHCRAQQNELVSKMAIETKVRQETIQGSQEELTTRDAEQDDHF